MSIITPFCLVIIVSILLLSLQASSTRPLRVVLHNKDPAQDHKRRLLDDLSDKNGDGTKWVIAKHTDHIPSRENDTLSREQPKGSISATANEIDQESRDHFEDYKKGREQTTQAESLAVVSNKKDTAKDGKMVKSQVNSSSEANPLTVSWHLPHQRQRKRKKKKRGISRDPEFTLDYAPPRVHPPCHN